jgi:murein DD-endopeptidase MepM/ murein hydrolase activator NlpD
MGVLLAAAAVTTVTIASNRAGAKPVSLPASPGAAPGGPTLAVADAPAGADAPVLETRLAYASGTIETNLFDDGQEAGLSDALISKLTKIFDWDVDFALGVRPGDRFSVVYEERYWLGQKVADGRILAAEFVNRGRAIRAIAHTDELGFTQYYTPSGLEMQRMFLRTPVKYTRISSRYTDKATRFHPILKHFTAHRAIDYAAPTGTPVRATAVGRIFAIGRDGGYGNRIIIVHGDHYRTVYGHLQRFETGLREGSPVAQGQIIGYVGSTGLATGPHLHYEFVADGVHHDPLSFKFPVAKQMPATLRDAFLQDAPQWEARLDSIANGIAITGADQPAERKIAAHHP